MFFRIHLFHNFILKKYSEVYFSLKADFRQFLRSLRPRFVAKFPQRLGTRSLVILATRLKDMNQKVFLIFVDNSHSIIMSFKMHFFIHEHHDGKNLELNLRCEENGGSPGLT